MVRWFSFLMYKSSLCNVYVCLQRHTQLQQVCRAASRGECWSLLNVTQKTHMLRKKKKIMYLFHTSFWARPLTAIWYSVSLELNVLYFLGSSTSHRGVCCSKPWPSNYTSVPVELLNCRPTMFSNEPNPTWLHSKRTKATCITRHSKLTPLLNPGQQNVLLGFVPLVDLNYRTHLHLLSHWIKSKHTRLGLVVSPSAKIVKKRKQTRG